MSASTLIIAAAIWCGLSGTVLAAILIQARTADEQVDTFAELWDAQLARDMLEEWAALPVREPRATA